MATPRLSTEYLCLLTNNLSHRKISPETSPHYPAGFWIPAFEGMTMKGQRPCRRGIFLPQPERGDVS